MMRLSPVRLARKRQKVEARDAKASTGAWRGLRRLVRDDKGLAALEFAMVGPIFLLLILGVLENALTLWQQSMLDNATRDAARLLETNQSGFATKLCNDISGLMKCSALQYRVKTASTFSTISPSYTTNSSGTATGFLAYPTAPSAGSTGQDMLVQVLYTRSYIVPWVGKIMSGSGDYRQLIATAAFQVEP